MSQIEQLKSIVLKEIKAKQWILGQEDKQGIRTRFYYEGSLAALRYIKYMIDKLNNDDSDSSRVAI